jgi:cell division GTPase FtsZ
MSVKTTTENITVSEVIDDLSVEEKKESKNSEELDLSKLAELRAKSQAKKQETNMAPKIVAKKERSLKLGVIGSGQAGSRIAECFYQQGYDAVVLNTALQDLKYIDVPDSNKLLLEYGVGGASKELSIGAAAAESHRGDILQLVRDKLSDSQINLLCLSLGGGSGAGSCETLVDILSGLGKPLVVITVLPMDTEDAQTKSNALETLAKLSSFAKAKKISNLLLVDNAKIESIYAHVSQTNFYSVANRAIVDTIDSFNTLSSMPSHTKALDPMEWTKIFIDGEGLSVYGELTVDNYTEPTAIAEAVINNLNGNLLASGFDLKQTRYAGFMVVSNKEVSDKIPAASVNYASAMINDLCGTPKGIFKGTYIVDIPEDVVKVYSIFSGLGLPTDRVDQLKKDAKELASKVKDKDGQRNLSLHLDTGTNETVSAAQKIKDQIAAKNSTFGKFVGGTIDRRK